MSKLKNSPFMKFIVNGSLILASVLITYILLELGYRAYLWHGYVINTEYPIIVVDIRLPNVDIYQEGNIYGPNPLSSMATFKRFDTDGSFIRQHTVRSNNLGWISHYDYVHQKEPSEFRIVVIGASLAACITNSFPWSDALQRYLNQDTTLLAAIGCKKISVLNISLPGADLGILHERLFPIAMNFSPDLIFFNFAISNLDGMKFVPKEYSLKLQTKKVPPYKKLPSCYMYLTVQDVEVPILCSGEKKLSNPNCKVFPLWYLPKGKNLTKEKLIGIKREVAKKLLCHRLVFSPKLFLLFEILGKPIIARPKTDLQAHGESKKTLQSLASGKFSVDIRYKVLHKLFEFSTPARALSNLSPPAFPSLQNFLPTQVQQYIQSSLNIFDLEKNLCPHFIVAHNTLLFYLNHADPGSLKKRDALIEAASHQNTNIVNMDDYLPVEKGSLEWAKWYEQDAHFSDYGADIYGKAVAQVIREYLLETGLKSSQKPPKSKACNALLLELARGKQALENGDTASALAFFSNGIKKHNEQKASLSQSDRNTCHAATELYQERAQLFESLQKPEQAFADWTIVSKLSPHSFRPYFKRAMALFLQQKYSESLEFFNKAFEVATETEKPALYFYRGSIYQTLHDYDRAIKELTECLTFLQDPKGITDILGLRASAYLGNNQYKEALQDYLKILEIQPNNEDIKKIYEDTLKQFELHKK